MKKLKISVAATAILLSFATFAPQNVSAFDCERKFEHKEGWKNRFLARGCKKKENKDCRIKTQGCGAEIKIGNVDIGG